MTARRAATDKGWKLSAAMTGNVRAATKNVTLRRKIAGNTAAFVTLGNKGVTSGTRFRGSEAGTRSAMLESMPGRVLGEINH